jgi:2-oxoacid dehydrogenases acyltransferase (catalytic domain)
LAFSEIEDGCFSVTNPGPLGGAAFTPTINAPEIAVLGIGRAVSKMVDADGEIAAHLMLQLTLAYVGASWTLCARGSPAEQLARLSRRRRVDTAWCA